MATRLKGLELVLTQETLEWPAKGLVLDEADASLATSLLLQWRQVLEDLVERYEGSYLALVDKSPFLWHLTYLGKMGGVCAGGVLKAKIEPDGNEALPGFGGGAADIPPQALPLN